MLWATTIILVPLAIAMLLGFIVRGVDFTEAAQTRHRRADHADPRGPRPADERHPRGRRPCGWPRMDTLVQQMSATEALAAVDTICVDKTGTLTDGTLRADRRRERRSRPGATVAERTLGRFAASAGERNRTLETIAEAFPAERAPGRRRGPVLLASGSGAG